MSTTSILEPSRSDRRHFSAFFSSHLDLPPAHPQREKLRVEIEDFFTTSLQSSDPLFNSLNRDAMALIGQIEALDEAVGGLRDELKGLGEKKRKEGLKMQELRIWQKRLEGYAVRKNGLGRFLERLGHRFAGVEGRRGKVGGYSWVEKGFEWREEMEGGREWKGRYDWVERNLRWRGKKMDDGFDFDGLVRWVAEEVEKEKEKRREYHANMFNRPGRGKRIWDKGIKKVEGKYPPNVQQWASQRHNQRRSRINITQDLGSIPLDPPQDPEKQHRWTGDLRHPWIIGRQLSGWNPTTSLKLYLRTDENDTIVDRLMEKNTSAKTTNAFCSLRQWHGPTPAQQGDPTRLVPTEWYTQALASSRPDARFIVGVRGYPRVSIQQRNIRMYVEYAPHGDLHDLMESYSERSGNALYEFVFLVFTALVEAGLIMERGGVKNAVPGWQQIVHRDLKPLNVFMDEPNPEHFPMYPRPKLADFGLAFLTEEDDDSNPAMYNQSRGTLGFFAPEAMQFVDEKTGAPVHDWKMLSPANVWGVGAIMHTLMNGWYNDDDDKTPETYLTMDIDRLPTWRSKYRESTKELYGKWMIDLVESCLFVDPEQRPTFEELYERLEWAKKMGPHSDLLCRAETKRDGKRALPKRKGELRYQLGMAFPARTRDLDVEPSLMEKMGEMDQMDDMDDMGEMEINVTDVGLRGLEVFGKSKRRSPKDAEDEDGHDVGEDGRADEEEEAYESSEGVRDGDTESRESPMRWSHESVI